MADYWKFVKPDPRGLEDNPLINPPKEADDGKPAVVSNPLPNVNTGASRSINLHDFLQLNDISCVDSNGAVFEHYDRLFVRKDIERDSNNSDNKTNQIEFAPYDAIVHFENQGLFLPSFALSCNILARLYAGKSDSEVASVLYQYHHHIGYENGLHVQNTVVNWRTSHIIHYPRNTDCTSVVGSSHINISHHETVFWFDNNGFVDTTLDAALINKNYRKFVQNLTGLQNPEVLVKIGNYLGRMPRVCIDTGDGTRASWLGCGSSDSGISDFGMDTGVGLGSRGAVRGVGLASELGAVVNK